MNHYSIYIGPYVRCTVDRVTEWKTIRSCSSDICDLVRSRRPFKPDENFCSRCGSPAAETSVVDSERDAIDPFHVMEAMDERLTTANSPENGVQLFIPNYGSPREMIVRAPDSELGELLEVSPSLISQELAWIKICYAKDLAIVRETYGADRVRIMWGLLGLCR